MDTDDDSLTIAPPEVKPHPRYRKGEHIECLEDYIRLPQV